MQNNFSKCREWGPRGTSQHKWRWLTTLLLILTLGIGQMWGDEYLLSKVRFNNGDMVAGMSSATVQWLKHNGTAFSATSDFTIPTYDGSTKVSGNGFYCYEKTLTGIKNVGTGTTWSSSSSSGRYLQMVKLPSGKDVTLALGTKVATKITIIAECGSTGAKTITIGGVSHSLESTAQKNTLFSHEFTKSGNFTGNITISQNADFYAAIILTVPATYTVTLNPNEGGYASTPTGWTAGTGVYTQTVVAGALTIPEPTRDDYDFNGWKSGTVDVVLSEGKLTVAKDTTLVAQWALAGSAYNVNIASMTNGSVVASPTSQAEDGTVTLTVTPDDGYLLSSLSVVGDVSGDEVTVTANQFTMPAEDVTVNATFSLAPTYTVTLNPAGGTIVDATGWTLNAGNYEKEVAEGTVLTLPTFTKTDRTFKTWRKAGPTDVTSPITVTADVTLTAVWNATVEQVIYSWEGAEGGATEVGGTAQSSTNGGSSFDNAQINVAQAGYYCIQLNGKNDYSTNIVEITLSGSEKVKAGDKIKFTAFYNKYDGETAKTANASFKMSTAKSGGNIFDMGTTDLLPHIYNGTGTPANYTKTVPDGINAGIVYLTRSQTGSTSWVSKLQIIRPTLVEEANIRTVTFNYNDGVTANVTVEVASGATVAAPANPTWAHHRFHEWQLGGVAYDFATAVTSNITLTADWTQLYTVTYAKGEESATGDAPTQDELAAGENFTVAANPFAYEGHDFSTWNDGSKDVAPASEYTMGAANVTLTAQWITATTKVTVTYKDGETTLGSEEITINTGHPAEYATYQTRNLATFDGWYSDPDLAEGNKIADISALTASANVNVYGKWNYQYASSANIEQWTLDNGKGISDAQKETQTGALMSLLGTRKYASNIAYDKGNIELDSLNDDPSKTNRNYAFLGLKVKKSGKMLDFRLAKDSYVKVKFGNIAATPKVSINGADYADMEITDGVYSYTATGNDYISIKTASDGAVVFKQIMINEPIADVTLPWRVTYDANGGTCATAEAIWSGAALILPDVTPADADHTFAGWYDEVSGGSLQGVAGASYNATDNITLHAQFAPVEYSVTYVGGEGATGSMGPEAKGWGLEYTALANTFEKSGHVFSGWTVTGVDGVSTIPALGSFTMPKNNVTLTAIWTDNSKVAQIVETNVKYESFAAAIAAVQADQKIQLLQDCEYSTYWDLDGSALTGTKTVTLDLNGHDLTYTGTKRGVQVSNGGTLILMDGTATVAPTIDLTTSPMARTAISYTSGTFDSKDGMCALAGSEIIINSGRYLATEGVILVKGPAATATVNDGVLICRDNSVIGGNGTNNADFRNYVMNIHGGILYGEIFSAGYASMVVYHPNVGELNIDGGILVSTNGPCVVTRGGETNITGGTLVALGSGSGKCGDASLVLPAVGIAVDFKSAYPGVASTDVAVSGTVDVTGQAGAVEAVYAAATPTATEESKVNISGGTFNTELTTDLCAPGYIPSAEVAPGVYTVVPKDGVEIIGVVTTGGTNKTVTGLYKGDASVDLDNSKKLADGKYIFVTLKEGYTFEETDVLIIDLAAKSDLGGGTKALEITTGIGNIDGAVWKSIAFDDYTTGENTISLAGIAAGQTSIGLKRSVNQNAKVNGIKVLRPMKPMLTAITINERVGVIDEANKTVAVTIPYESDLAALTVVPTIAWNEAAAANSIVVNNGGAWVENPNTNTYKLTDKDGDYTVYTITLTRDVLKHTVSFNTHGGSAVASQEIVHGEYLAAAPADPTKDENVFKHWAETEDGEAVDVTSFAITADKEFHAVWEAEPAGIKLITDLGLNTTDFVSPALAEDSIVVNAVKYPYLVQFGSNKSSFSSITKADMVQYNATTNATKMKVTLYNNSTSEKKAYLYMWEEGAAGDDVVKKEITLPGKKITTSEYYEFNSNKNRSFYVCMDDRSNTRVLQVKVIESGDAIHQFGQMGYSLNFNKGRLYAKDGVATSFEGFNFTVASEYKVNNQTTFQSKAVNSFSITSPVIMHVERSGGKYYVYQDPANKGTLYDATADIELNATGTWYICSETSSSSVTLTGISFTAPKCAEPQFNALANSDVCAGDGYVALVGTATVADAGVPTYQWYREDNSAIDGETNATYTPTADGKYYVIAVNHLAGYTDNEKKSALVTVTTHAGTVITEPLVDLRGAENAELALTVEATGKNLHYAWKESATIDGTYTDVAGATDSKTLNVTVIEGMDKYYKVVVSSDCGSDLESVAHVTQFVPVSQQDVTASIVWDWSEAASGNTDEMKNNTTPVRDTEFIMANGDARIYNNANFWSDKLVISGQYAVRGGNYFQGGLVKFHTTVPGVVRVEFSHTGTATAEKPARELFINGVGTGASAASTSHVRTAFIEVPAGDVSITAQYIDPTKPGNQYVRVYKVEFYTIAEQRTTGYAAGDLGTVCLEDETFIEGANLYQLAGLDENGYLAFNEIQSGELEAGKPYLFEVTNPSMIGFYKQVNAAHSDDEIAHKGMIGTFSGTTLNQNVAENYYYFSGRHIWRVNDFTVGITIPAHRCYVDYDAVQAAGPAQAPAAGCRRVTLGVNGKNNATDVENLNASEAPVKLIIDGKMYILRGEKLFDATGRLVK
ncbi:MAG: InlB B-repeat-containing protein [Paludibacteraceae bacterium]|nr:InlB B-repeat-containing protein [Paludibacteraceae bacterium]